MDTSKVEDQYIFEVHISYAALDSFTAHGWLWPVSAIATLRRICKSFVRSRCFLAGSFRLRLSHVLASAVGRLAPYGRAL